MKSDGDEGGHRTAEAERHCPAVSRSGCWAVAEFVVERTILFQVTTRSARAISQGYFQNKFEFCTIDTARNRNRILEPKLGRAEGATLMHSPRRIQNPKGFSTLRVAQKVRFDQKF